MPNVPSSSRPPQRPAGQAELRRPLSRRSTGQMEKVKLPKAAQATEDHESLSHLWGAGGDDMSRAEASLKDLEQQATETAQQQHAEGSSGKEEARHTREETHRSEARAQGKPATPGAPARPATPPATRGPLQRLAQAQGQSLQQLARKSGNDGFQKLDAKGMALSSTSYNNLSAVGQLQNKLAGVTARAERPPDAFKLLKDARDSGVLFKEDSQREGHSEEQEDPELAAAVEECIRLCFGVRGILRIGAGHNDADQPVIVVVAAQGFSEASFAKVPALVHRFPTLVAIPFDLLPLRRDL